MPISTDSRRRERPDPSRGPAGNFLWPPHTGRPQVERFPGRVRIQRQGIVPSASSISVSDSSTRPQGKSVDRSKSPCCVVTLDRWQSRDGKRPRHPASAAPSREEIPSLRELREARDRCPAHCPSAAPSGRQRPWEQWRSHLLSGNSWPGNRKSPRVRLSPERISGPARITSSNNCTAMRD